MLLTMATPPVKTLPPEILSVIFSLALPPGSSYDVHSRKQSPLNVSQVCSSWRDVSLATPSLWSHLAFPGRIVYTHYEDIWSLWLARSKRQTLSFTVAHHLPHDIALRRRLVQIMVDNFDRWRDIYVELLDMVSVIIPYFPPTLESLHSIGFSVVYRTPSMTAGWLKDLISSSEWAYTNECHGVTAVSLQTVPRNMYERLSCATGTNNDSNENLDDMNLSRYAGRTGHESDLFPSSLQSLDVIRYDFESEKGTFNFADLICRSTVSIEVLILSYVDISTIELRSVLLHSFKLKELLLTGCDYIDVADLYNLLRVQSNTTEVTCPALEVFQICGIRTSEGEDARPFMEMVVSRWGYAKSKGMSLSVIEQSYEFCDTLSSDQKRELQKCISEGLHYRRGYLTGPESLTTP